MKFFLRYSPIVLVFLFIAGSCAKMGSLTGGPVDEDPPIVTGSEPENYSVNFEGQRIEINFNEFIRLDNVNQELVVSPPLENRPDVRMRGKSILIELENELRDSTTYTFNFGTAIKDNNEGNELTNYEFVFSTGDYLDSLSIGGEILRAFNLEPPEKPVNIMLYDNLYDSVVYKEIPVYIGKSTKEGTYRINNLKADTFKLFALNDVNNNFLFDLPNEQIAFLDTTVIITPEFFSKIEEVDSLVLDSISGPLADTIMLSDTVNLTNLEEDSLMVETEKPAPDRIYVDLFLFTEDSESQFLSDYNRETRRKVDFSFNLPVTDSFTYRSLKPANQDWYLEETTEEKKEFVLWVVDEEVIQKDSIKILMSYVVTDSMNQKAWQEDTLNFTYREPPRSGEEEKEEEQLKIETIRNRAILELNAISKFISETPVKSIDSTRIEFYKIVDDTLEFREPYDIYKDSLNIRTVIFDKDWEPQTSYHFIAYPGAFEDVYEATNDTIDVGFSVREEEYYGSLIVNPDTVITPLVVQLLDTNNEILREQPLPAKEKVVFDYMEPGKYKLKLIYDRNENGKWDTGNYLKGIQPEKVQYYPDEINVRANWELEINVEITESSVP